MGDSKDSSGGIERFYDDWAAKREASTLEQDYVRRADEWKWSCLEPMIRASGPPPRSILEFGCGSGEMLELAGRAFPAARLYGIDLSERMVAMARKRLPEAHLRLGGLELFESGAEEVDLVLGVDILEHLEDPVRAARAFGRAGERIALKIPLERRVVRLGIRGRSLSPEHHVAGHLHFWTLGESRALLRQAGLTIAAEACADPPESIRCHAAGRSAVPARREGAAVQLLRQTHHELEVQLERWTCAHTSTLHRLMFGSSHFVLARRKGEA